MAVNLDDVALPPHVRAELDAGRLWRAKEILASRAAQNGGDPDVHEQYGIVLLATSDLYEAGRHLFLSGRRAPEYEESIAIFLSRHRDKDAVALLKTLPAGVKAVPVERLPRVVRDELRARDQRKPRTPRTAPRDDIKPSNLAWLAGCVALAVLLVASVIAGLPVVFRTIMSLFDNF